MEGHEDAMTINAALLASNCNALVEAVIVGTDGCGLTDG
jgi:hypothetical protein